MRNNRGTKRLGASRQRWAWAVLAAAATGALLAPSPSSQAQETGLSQGGRNAGINIMRDVPYRPAVRLGLPAPPFRVRTTPAPEVLAALDEGRVITRVISDGEAAQITAGVPVGLLEGGLGPSALGLSATITRNTSRTIVGGGLSGIGGVGEIGVAAGGAVRSATGGIAGTIRGALGLTGR